MCRQEPKNRVPTTADSRAEYGSVSCDLSLWTRLCVDRECTIFILATYTMIKYAETKKNCEPLSNFVVLLLAVRCRVRKKKRIPGSLSLSLSLSLLHWRREREERSEGVGPWLGPTTPAVISNHPGYHIGGVPLRPVPYRRRQVPHHPPSSSRPS